MKKINTFTIIVAILFSLFISACAPAYIPNVVNTPLLNNKHETQIGAYAGVSGSDLQASYAITDHIGIMLNSSFRNNVSDSSDNYHMHKFIETGIGYHSKFSKDGHFEIYSGYGYGMADIQTTVLESTIYTKATYQRIFLQPNFGFSSKMFDLSFSPRFVMVNIDPDYLQYSTKTKFFVEPTSSLKLGYKYFFLTSQLGFSIPLTKIENADWFEYQPLIFSIGFQIKIGRIYDNKPMYNN